MLYLVGALVVIALGRVMRGQREHEPRAVKLLGPVKAKRSHCWCGSIMREMPQGGSMCSDLSIHLGYDED